MTLNRPMLLAFLSLLLTIALAQCKGSCKECTGKEYCIINNKPDCIEGNVDCTDPCLDLEIHNTYCFKSSIPDGKNCDNSCDYCIKQYKCNLVMNDLGICNEDEFDCTFNKACLEGEPKKLCAGRSNNGNCHEDCDVCHGADNCVVSNSTQCSNRKIDCLGKCLHKDVRQAECFKSSIPDGSNCDESCNFCIDQFECNEIMKNASLCSKDIVNCVTQGACLTNLVLDSCGMERNTDRQCAGCDACFTSVDCKERNNTRNELFGLCDGDQINCDGRCVASRVTHAQCESLGFCTLAKSASIWQKAKCFVVATIIFILAIIVCIIIGCARGSKSKDRREGRR